jgi:hypothetical protein
VLPDKPSIPVLPFINMRGDPEQEYFTDGITEDIITASGSLAANCGFSTMSRILARSRSGFAIRALTDAKSPFMCVSCGLAMAHSFYCVVGLLNLVQAWLEMVMAGFGRKHVFVRILYPIVRSPNLSAWISSPACSICLKGTLLFHYEVGRPWSLALPRFPDAVFHYLSRGSAIVVPEVGPAFQMAAGDFVLISRGDPLSSARVAGPGRSHYSILIVGRRISASCVTVASRNHGRR